MAKKERRTFTQDQKREYVDGYRAAVKKQQGLKYLEDEGLSSSHIASFESSLGIKKGKKGGKNAKKTSSRAVGDEMLITLWGKSGTIPEIKTALATAVDRLGGKVSWSRP